MVTPPSEASCRDPVDATELDVAVATPPASPPMTSTPQRSRSGQQPRRLRRERHKKERYALLHAMTAEQRYAHLNQETIEKHETQQRLERAAASDSSSQRIAIDLSFDSLMNEKELRSLAKQLKLCYGAVKKMPEPFQLIFCNPSEQLEHSLDRFGASHWHVQWRRNGNSIAEHFQADQLVYLSPDSPHVLDKIDPEKVYVIGGLVDKSRKKGATLDAAVHAGVPTVRLPIQENVPERLDHILNVNTVVDVLIVSREIDDWSRVLELALPQRKRSQVGRKALRRRQKQQMLFPAASKSGQAKQVVPGRHVGNKTELDDGVPERPGGEVSPTESLDLWLWDAAA